jgi:hypothetical protein
MAIQNQLEKTGKGGVGERKREIDGERERERGRGRKGEKEKGRKREREREVEKEIQRSRVGFPACRVREKKEERGGGKPVDRAWGSSRAPRK